MSLLEAVHQRWAAAVVLNDLLPASRVYTGMSADPQLPYAVLTRRSEQPLVYYNDGSVVTLARLRVELLHHDYDAAAAIGREILAVFDRAALGLSGDDKILHMQRSNSYEQQQEDGVWHFVIELDCTTYLA